MWGHISRAPVPVPFLLCSVHSLLAQAIQLARAAERSLTLTHLPSSKIHSVHPDSVTHSLYHDSMIALTPFISPTELPWDALPHEQLSPCAP